MSDKTSRMREVRDKIWNLKESPLYEYRAKNKYYPVIGEGSHEARVVFVGEAPGKNEAEQGKPFCGAAGRILDELLASIEMSREDVYVTNIVKDRPPHNRDPRPDEIALYSPFLLEQIAIIEPKIIATLGRFSMKFLLDQFDSSEKDKTISQNHGKAIEVTASYGTVQILPLFHPAVALYNSNTKKTLLEDFEKLKKIL